LIAVPVGFGAELLLGPPALLLVPPALLPLPLDEPEFEFLLLLQAATLSVTTTSAASAFVDVLAICLLSRHHRAAGGPIGLHVRVVEVTLCGEILLRMLDPSRVPCHKHVTVT
jgi:hypothetical protein